MYIPNNIRVIILSGDPPYYHLLLAKSLGLSRPLNRNLGPLKRSTPLQARFRASPDVAPIPTGIIVDA